MFELKCHHFHIYSFWLPLPPHPQIMQALGEEDVAHTPESQSGLVVVLNFSLHLTVTLVCFKKTCTTMSLVTSLNKNDPVSTT